MRKFVQIESNKKLTLFDVENITSVTVERESPEHVCMYVIGKTEGVYTFKFDGEEVANKQYVKIKNALTDPEEV